MGNLQQKPRESPNNPQEEEEVSSFTCEICIEPMSANRKFKNKNHCAHPFCLDCIAKYIEVKVQDNNANIECPGLNCQNHLDPLCCRPIVPQSLFSKWCDLLCDNAVLGFESSYCPNRNCMALVVNECGGTVKKSKCPNCKELFCFQCKLAWHAGYQCEESRELRDSNDVLFGQLVERKNWTRCPGCGHCVELRRGCSIVRCRCKTRFCYNCGRKLFAHVCQCKQRVDNTDVPRFYCLSLSMYIPILITAALLIVLSFYDKRKK